LTPVTLLHTAVDKASSSRAYEDFFVPRHFVGVSDD
jgi:hypothetical protein